MSTVSYNHHIVGPSFQQPRTSNDVEEEETEDYRIAMTHPPPSQSSLAFGSGVRGVRQGITITVAVGFKGGNRSRRRERSGNSGGSSVWVRTWTILVVVGGSLSALTCCCKDRMGFFLSSSFLSLATAFRPAVSVATTMYFDDVSRYYDSGYRRKLFLTSTTPLPRPPSPSSLSPPIPRRTKKMKVVVATDNTTATKNGTAATTTNASASVVDDNHNNTTCRPRSNRLLVPLSEEEEEEENEKKLNNDLDNEAEFRKRMFVKYNATLAAQLSDDQIAQLTELWSTRAGVVVANRASADRFQAATFVLGDELYRTLWGIRVSNATSLVAAMASLWTQVATLIQAHTDEFDPTKWSSSSSSCVSQQQSLLRRQFHSHYEADQVHFVVFPHCPALYEYKTLVTLASAMEFVSKEQCLHWGKRLTLGLFHPHYPRSSCPTTLTPTNTCTTLSSSTTTSTGCPERHSPFPTLALQLLDESEVVTRVRKMDQSYSDKIMSQRRNKKRLLLSNNQRQRGINGVAAKKQNRRLLGSTYNFLNQFEKIDNDGINNNYNDDDEDEDDKDNGEAIRQFVYGKIHDLDAKRKSYEVLFNSAAVPGSDGLAIGEIRHADVVIDHDNALVAVAHPKSYGSNNTDDIDLNDDDQGRDHILTQSFAVEKQVRRRRLSDNQVIEICYNWIRTHRTTIHTDHRDRIYHQPQVHHNHRRLQSENRALRYMDANIQKSRWIISSEKVAEMEFAKIWNVIRELYEIGQQRDYGAIAAVVAAADDDVLNSEVPPSVCSTTLHNSRSNGQQSTMESTTQCTTDSNQFSFFLFPFASPRPSVSTSYATTSNEKQPVIVESSILVSTKFCAFNAPAFKRFAISVNAVLKRITNGQMFLEVFHNEYVGRQGYDHSLRRSPFPMIQVCYRVLSSPPARPTSTSHE